MKSPEVGIQIDVKEDKKYYRVYLRFGTHALHSEKLNIETAMDLSHELKKVVEGYESVVEKIKKVLEKST